MTFPVHSFRELRHSALALVLLIALAGIAGCGSDNSSGGMVSPPGWVVVPSGGQHATSATLTYIANGGTSSCAECHGADLSGGTSKVSCFENPAGCHHGPVAGWVAAPPAPQNHGVSAKNAPGSSGFASCKVCHGADFRIPRGGGNRTCYSCHSLAPHPDRPWRSPTGSTHTTTDPSNAPVCADCHRNNTSGTPGCFNSTLCHGEATVPHPVGSAWVATSPAAQPHANDAKATPGATTGFTYCQACHGTGTDFAGGSSGVSCYPCHSTTANSPHASQWRTGDTYVHTTTAEGNASVCGFCHLNGANSPIAPPSSPAPAGTAPGCFNNTLCHGAGSAPHPLGSAWVAASPAAQPHGDSAKAMPGGIAGFTYCQACHGTGTTPPANFGGGSSGVSCLTCHGNPHAPAPWRASAGSIYNHTNTDPGNAPICAQCHFPGSLANPANHPPSPAPAGTPPGCFNSTLCHGEVVAHPVPYNADDHYTVTSATFPAGCSACHDVSAPTTKVGPVCRTCHAAASPLAAADCTSCHGNPPSGATYPNVAGKHAVHDVLPGVGVCNPCHNGLDTGTLEHYNRANGRPGKDALRVPPGDIAFLGAYDAESGSAAFNPSNRTCSNVICHGGRVTPDWQTATANAIDVPNACLSCHVSGTTQHNSYFSGRHNTHIDEFGLSATTCKRCHDASKVNVTGHFQNLATPAFEQPPRETILPDVQYNGNSCNPRAGGLTGCHGRENW